MFGKKHRLRADELQTRLDAVLQTNEQLRADLETARYVQRTAINAREEAENISASQRGELAARADTIRRLNGTELARENDRLKAHAAALEKCLAGLQAANESAYADLAARAGTAPGSVEDDDADTAALIGGAR
jgi:predicted phage tail protein